MEISRQNQTAGDNAQQVQVGNATNLTIVNGITEQRAREIFLEMNQLALSNYTQDAYTEALRRIRMLEILVMDKAEKVEGVLEAFGDPAFQILLAEAQKRAAATEREVDYQLLSELLVCHVQKGASRTNRAGINRAVEIVSDIDTIALCALTVAHSIGAYLPITGKISEGLQVLNEMFTKLVYESLPSGNSWLDHLDVLGAVRLSSFGEMKKICQYYSIVLNGYVCTGIQSTSDDYKRAVEALNSAYIGSGILVDNELLEGYVRLNIRNEKAIDDLAFTSRMGEIQLSPDQKAVLRKVFSMYSKESALKQEAQKRFLELWDSYEVLATVKQWWDNIPGCFHVTQVGRVLAHTNAKRCDSSIPDLI